MKFDGLYIIVISYDFPAAKSPSSQLTINTFCSLKLHLKWAVAFPKFVNFNISVVSSYFESCLKENENDFYKTSILTGSILAEIANSNRCFPFMTY